MITQERISTFLGKERFLEESSSGSADTIELVAAVREALAGIDRGEFVTFEEIKKEFSSWFIE